MKTILLCKRPNVRHEFLGQAGLLRPLIYDVARTAGFVMQRIGTDAHADTPRRSRPGRHRLFVLEKRMHHWKPVNAISSTDFANSIQPVRPPGMLARRRCVAIASQALLAGCSVLPRLRAVPPEEVANVKVLGLSDIRYWGDENTPSIIEDAQSSYDRKLSEWRNTGHMGPLPPAAYLAISGGGENGAFGAGFLNGWTEAGTRPSFKLVTGISTGALIAPFAFLGPRYDPALREIYTTISAENVLSPRNYISALLDDALATTGPLRQMIARYLNQSMLDEIVAKHERGGLLLIGTTDLDQGRPVIWNFGKLAASGAPGSLELMRDILIASASIPGAFPPVMINVEVDGKRYQEMHADGGVSTQVFVYPPSLQLNRQAPESRIVRARQLYLIRNAKLEPDWVEVRRRTLPIVRRALGSLIQTQGIGDLYRIYVAADRDRIDFNLASIPKVFTDELKEPFQREYMNDLFKIGYDLAANGYAWSKYPPGYEELGAGPTLMSGSLPADRQNERADVKASNERWE
jgi:predicted acylesterase/phospholipase RssA